MEYFTALKKTFKMWLVERGRTHGTGTFWACRDMPVACVSNAGWTALDHLGSFLYAADVFLNPGIAGFGADLPAPIGDKAVEKADV